MRLTNTIRDAYIRAVLDDVPQVDYSEKIRDLVYKDIVNALPPEVKKVYNNSKTKGYIREICKTFGKNHISITYPSLEDRWNSPIPKLSEKAEKELAKLDDLLSAQSETFKALKQKITGSAYACSTRKQLAELIPEFEKYLPESDPQAIKTLPALANVYSDFKKAGFPKPKAKEAQHA